MVVVMALLLLFAIIVFLNITFQLMKLVDKNSKIISELRLEIFSLTCDKMHLESENEFLHKRLEMHRRLES